MTYYQDILSEAMPEVIWTEPWFEGDYNGDALVYGIRTTDNKILVVEGYYGSCGGCGAWEDDYPDREALEGWTTEYDNPKEALDHELYGELKKIPLEERAYELQKLLLWRKQL